MALARRNAAARPDALGFLYIDGHGRAAFGPEMMVALLLYGYGQGERSGRVTGKRWVRDVACRVIARRAASGSCRYRRFRARHETALGGLFSQVLRLLAAEGMVSPGTLSLDGAKLAGNAARKADRTLPQIGKILAGAAAADAAGDAREGGSHRRPRGRWPAGPGGGSGWPGPGTGWRPGTRRVARRSGRSRRRGTRPQQPGSGAGAARQASRRARTGPGPGRGGITGPDVPVMRNHKGYVAGCNGQAVVTAGQVIAGAMLSRHPAGRTLPRPLPDTCREQLTGRASSRSCVPCPAGSGYASEENFARAGADGLRLPAPLAKDPGMDQGRHRRHAPRRTRHLDQYPATARAVRRLRHHRGKADGKLRARTAEPVFGQPKTCQELTMTSRRGHAGCSTLKWPHCSLADSSHRRNTGH